MVINEKLTETLNDLIKINIDRIEGYEKAAEQVKSSDVDLVALFNKMAAESRAYKQELETLVSENGGEAATDATVAGKIYRTWMDIRNTFTGHDRKSVLASCEYGEDKAQQAYETALASDADIDVEARQLIVKQKQSLKESHDTIKKYRDMHTSS